MIQSKSAQNIIVLTIGPICMTYLRNDDGSICLGNGKSATECLTHLLEATQESYQEILEMSQSIFSQIDFAKRVFQKSGDPIQDLFLKQMASERDRLQKVLVQANTECEEIKDLIVRAMKFDRVQEQVSCEDSFGGTIHQVLEHILALNKELANKTQEDRTPQKSCGECRECYDDVVNGPYPYKAAAATDTLTPDEVVAVLEKAFGTEVKIVRDLSEIFPEIRRS